jgi:hypothetical protein
MLIGEPGKNEMGVGDMSTVSPELITFLDKLTFTSALLIAVYILYKDSRSDTVQRQQKNAEAIFQLTTQVAALAVRTELLVTQVDRLTISIESMLTGLQLKPLQRLPLAPSITTKPSSFDRGVVPPGIDSGAERGP